MTVLRNSTCRQEHTGGGYHVSGRSVLILTPASRGTLEPVFSKERSCYILSRAGESRRKFPRRFVVKSTANDPIFPLWPKAVAAALTAIALACGAGRLSAAALTFQDILDSGDPTFNQALGINNSGLIAGYFGSGAVGHPNKGYTVPSPYTSFTNENFPGSSQTQVTGLNNIGTSVGFWSNTNNGSGADSNFGFVDVGGTFTSVNNPATGLTTPVFNQLLGVNDGNIAVGFYT